MSTFQDGDFFIDEASGIAIKNGKRYYDVGVSDDRRIIAKKHERTENKDDEDLSEEYLRSRSAVDLIKRPARTDEEGASLNLGTKLLNDALASREQSWRLNHELRESGDLRGIPPRNYFSTRNYCLDGQHPPVEVPEIS